MTGGGVAAQHARGVVDIFALERGHALELVADHVVEVPFSRQRQGDRRAQRLCRGQAHDDVRPLGPAPTERGGDAAVVFAVKLDAAQGFAPQTVMREVGAVVVDDQQEPALPSREQPPQPGRGQAGQFANPPSATGVESGNERCEPVWHALNPVTSRGVV